MDPRPVVVVLLGERCDAACEVIARALHAYVAANVVGTVGSERRMPLSDTGLLVLPRSGVHVFVPTTAHVVNPHLARVTGDGHSWFDRRGQGGRAGSVGEVDRLQVATQGVRAQLVTRARLARWQHEEPAPCASFQGYARAEDLPAAARQRLQGGWMMPGREQEVFAFLDLSMERATAYVNGCPGLRASGAYYNQGAALSVAAASFEALSRLMQSEAVQRVTIGPMIRNELTGVGSER